MCDSVTGIPEDAAPDDPAIEAVAEELFKIANEEDFDDDDMPEWPSGVGLSIQRDYREQARRVLAAARAVPATPTEPLEKKSIRAIVERAYGHGWSPSRLVDALCLPVGAVPSEPGDQR